MTMKCNVDTCIHFDDWKCNLNEPDIDRIDGFCNDYDEEETERII